MQAASPTAPRMVAMHPSHCCAAKIRVCGDAGQNFRPERRAWGAAA
jgi:hypothetical protein